MRLLTLALALAVAVPALAQEENCTNERFEAIKGVSVQAERCNGELKVTTPGFSHDKNKNGVPLTFSYWTFGSHRYQVWEQLTVFQFDDGGTIEVESTLRDMVSTEVEALLKTPGFKLKTDERTAWGRVDWLPARTVRLEKSEETLPNGTTRAIIPEIMVVRVIVDTRHHRAYMLLAHGWAGVVTPDAWLETLFVKYE